MDKIHLFVQRKKLTNDLNSNGFDFFGKENKILSEKKEKLIETLGQISYRESNNDNDSQNRTTINFFKKNENELRTPSSQNENLRNIRKKAPELVKKNNFY